MDLRLSDTVCLVTAERLVGVDCLVNNLGLAVQRFFDEVTDRASSGSSTS